MGRFYSKTEWEDKASSSLFLKDSCDKFDYLIAIGCGAIAGLVDIFLVGSPVDSKLQTWTDSQVDKAVMTFAKQNGWKPREGKEKSIAGAIGFLERKFPVNYDQRHKIEASKVSGLAMNHEAVASLKHMSAGNHHFKSLSHAPDLLGLFFSIINQFTLTSTFLNEGKLITISTGDFELYGTNVISKIFCGIANWFGHLMSDIAGSSSAVGRGSGLPIPFMELFNLCDFGRFSVGEHKNTLAKVATKAFEEGYDARFGLTMAMPVVLCELSIKLIWAIKRHFYHKQPLNACIPTKEHTDLRRIILLGNGVLCVMDGIDAAVRSGGNWVLFFLRLNIIAWTRLVWLAFREVCIRLNIPSTIKEQLETYRRINIALSEYMEELKEINLEEFHRETDKFHLMLKKLNKMEGQKELEKFLLNEYEELGIELPYKGDFREFMLDENAILEFK